MATPLSSPGPAGDTATPAAPARRPRGVALWLLGAAVMATAVGVAAATFRGDGTAINAYLFLTLEYSHAEAARIERVAASVILAMAVILLLRPWWPGLLVVGAYFFAEALARWHEQGQPFSEWALTAQSPRYLTPLAMIFLWMGVQRGAGAGHVWQAAGAGVLRVGLALVFAVHGLECLRAHPSFIDYILSTTINLADWRLSESAATRMLQGIGFLDLMVAAALLFRPHPAVLLWAVFWGLVTALSRMTAYGWAYYPDLLVRAPHFLGPLALWFLSRQAPKAHALGVPASTSG